MNDISTKAAEAPQDIYSLFEGDPQAEADGIWHDVGASRFRIRSISAPEVQKIRIGQLRRQSRILQNNGGVLPEAIARANEAELAAAVITDWEKVPSPPWWTEKFPPTGLPFTADLAKKLMGEMRLRKLRDLVLARSGDDDAFRAAELGRQEGNSAVPSGGTSPLGNMPTA